MTHPSPWQAPGQQVSPPPSDVPLPLEAAYAAPVQQPRVPLGTNGFAVTSLVFGILPLGAGIAAIILGSVGLTQIKKRGGKGKGLAIAGITLGTAWLVGSIVVASLNGATRDNAGNITDKGDINVHSLRVGDCVNWPGANTAEIEEMPVVSCAQPHDGEVFAEFNIVGEPFPGDEALQDIADEGCASRFKAYASAAHEADDSVYLTYLVPTERSWAREDRAVTCIAESENGKLTGSIKG